MPTDNETRRQVYFEAYRRAPRKTGHVEIEGTPCDCDECYQDGHDAGLVAVAQWGAIWWGIFRRDGVIESLVAERNAAEAEAKRYREALEASELPAEPPAG